MSNDKMRAYLDEIRLAYDQFDLDVQKSKSQSSPLSDFYSQWQTQKQAFQSFYDEKYGHEWYSSFESCSDIMNAADPYYDALDNFRAKFKAMGGKPVSPEPPNPSDEWWKDKGFTDGGAPWWLWAAVGGVVLVYAYPVLAPLVKSAASRLDKPSREKQ